MVTRADDAVFVWHAETFEDRLTRAHQSTLAIFGKEVNPWQMFKQQMKLLSFHLGEEVAADLTTRLRRVTI